MPVKSSDPVVNRLIEGLPRRERRGLLTDGTLMDLAVGDTLCEPGQPYRHAYFPLTGFISLVATVRDHQPLEIAMIGNEGMLGATLVLGIGNAPLSGVVQGAGTALRISALNLRRRLRESPGMVRALNRYLYVSMAQLSQTAACTRFHDVEARLVRWLLMTHDRVQTDNFHLTHQLLADMLGVRRSAVTIAAGVFRVRSIPGVFREYSGGVFRGREYSGDSILNAGSQSVVAATDPAIHPLAWDRGGPAAAPGR